MWGEDPTESIVTQLGMLGPLPDVINSTMFHLNRSSSLPASGVRKSAGPLERRPDLTTVKPYRAYCDI
jgi:hypothetical protein